MNLPDISGVTPIQGEALRYWVQSESNPKIRFLVDLTENHGSGECCCKDWATRKAKAVREGQTLFTHATTCKHIRKCYLHFQVNTLRDIADQLAKPRRTRQQGLSASGAALTTQTPASLAPSSKLSTSARPAAEPSRTTPLRLQVPQAKA